MPRRNPNKGIDGAAILCDPEPTRECIEFRGAARDAWKLPDWDEYVSGLKPDTSPPTAHITVDDRSGSAITFADQTHQSRKRILT
ncbi:hypothetical protein [Microbispora sp. KK1-11]|uniref:hypothetical protein n=1 Tax=Microbispora sp. KK1-11 TaxID=2053005 RepID=UPI00163BA50E|nr:hypothetical protein [Microbispora sp. KK1-11]